MKKSVLLLFALTFIFTSCSIDDDGPQIAAEYAEVLEHDLPEFFEKGKTYEIEITYLLPSACHTPAGLEARRGNPEGEGRREIYIAGVSTYDRNVVTCTRESDELERTGKFSIMIDEDEDYTFYLWTGFDSEMENEYTIVEVPVGLPDVDEENTPE